MKQILTEQDLYDTWDGSPQHLQNLIEYIICYPLYKSLEGGAGAASKATHFKQKWGNKNLQYELY